MNCWNCHKTIPDLAKSCPYCEVKQDRTPPPPPDVMKEILGQMSPRDLEQLRKASLSAATAEDFIAGIMIGPCPACGSPKTETCEDVDGIGDIFVGRCKDCCSLFCTECGQVFQEGNRSCPSPECPNCGSSNTNYPDDLGPTDEDGDGPSPADTMVVHCHDCGTDYCYACGTIVDAGEDGVPE